METGEMAASAWAQFQTVWAAPLPFFSAILFFGWLIWFIVRREYSTRLENAASNLDLANARVADYERKLAGASPDEAKALIEALEKRLDALSPRRFTAEQRQAVIASISPGNGRRLSIAADAGSADAQNFTRSMAQAFTTAGWEVALPMVMGIGNPPLSGIGFAVINPAALSSDEQEIVGALRAAGLEFDIMPRRDHPQTLGRLPIVAELTVTNKSLD